MTKTEAKPVAEIVNALFSKCLVSERTSRNLRSGSRPQG